MTITYKIAAEVVDIRNDSPRDGDIFFVDTNVWYWMTYNRASSGNNPPMRYQVNDYPRYISNALKGNSSLHRCELSLAELAHIIERTELEIYNQNNTQIKLKEYRHNLESEREKVVNEIKSSWSQVKSMSETVVAVIDEIAATTAEKCLSNSSVDGYDVFILNSIIKAGFINIITDDGDYSTVPNVRVFTANTNVINSAKIRGKLIKR